MSATENKALIRHYWNELSGQEKPLAILNQYVDNEELKQHILMDEAAFPRYEVTAKVMFAKDDLVAVHATIWDKHTGDFMGMPPTHREFSQPFQVMFCIAGGKIVEQWIANDQLDLMQQLGLMPLPRNPALSPAM